MSQEHYDMVFEIDSSGEYLNGSETDFIEDMLNQAEFQRPLSEKQKAWIQRIWDRIFK